MNKGTILYVGGFVLPDKNAAAQRVVSIAKILRDIDYNVVFLNKTPFSQKSNWIEKTYYGFKCFEQKKGNGKIELVRELTDIEYIKDYVRKIDGVVAIIAYNFPAIALRKLNSYCKSQGIKCIGDVTEWYGSKDRSIAYKLIKGFDTFYRMRIVQKRLNGNIVISDFLEEYYLRSTKVVNIPPLVDKADKKWDCSCAEHAGVHFIYAGTPSSEKERLDLIVEAIVELQKSYDVDLKVLGITQEQFVSIYSDIKRELSNAGCVHFLGRIPHEEVIKRVSESDYSILIRDKNRVNTAGFPTKFIESLSCGTAVIANQSSCISKFFSKGENGFLISELTLKEDLDTILKSKKYPLVRKDLFDYRNYIEPLRKFMES